MAEDKGDTSEYIIIKVLGEDNAVYRFRIKKHDPLKLITESYCAITGFEVWSTIFLFEGRRIWENQTPSSLDMTEEDRNMIQVFQQHDVINEDTSEYIIIKVLGEDNAVYRFRIKKHDPLKLITESYCAITGLEKWSTRFYFDGYSICENDTPSSYGMKEGDGDTIEAFQQQIG